MARGLGAAQVPQKLWDKWCKILHVISLLKLNFFCTIFLIFSAIVQDKRPFFTTFDYIVAAIQALELPEIFAGCWFLMTSLMWGLALGILDKHRSCMWGLGIPVKHMFCMWVLGILDKHRSCMWSLGIFVDML